MSTRFPSRIASINREIRFATPDRRILKFDLLDAVFLAMILISVVGLTYEWLR